MGVSEAELRRWPQQRIADYARIWRIENALNSEQHAAGAGGGQPAGAMSQADATEQAYRLMAAQSKPRTPA
ncbi:hypothetical protein ACWGCW_01055 [Streptomyces sp. NPDC054933]